MGGVLWCPCPVSGTAPRVASDRQSLSESSFSAAFERARDAMLLTEDDGRYVGANPAACNLLGVERDDLLKLRVGDVLWPTATHRATGTRSGR